MTEQLSLLQEQKSKRPALRAFTISVRGKNVRADFQEDYCEPYIYYDRYGKVKSIFATHHLDFRTDESGPISESGYRSYFFHGTLEELGIEQDNPLPYIQEIAEWLADIYEKEAPERVRHKKWAVKHGYRQINGGWI